MPISASDKKEYLIRAIEIARSAAAGGGQGSTSDANLARIIKTNYEQMVSPFSVTTLSLKQPECSGRPSRQRLRSSRLVFRKRSRGKTTWTKNAQTAYLARCRPRSRIGNEKRAMFRRSGERQLRRASPDAGRLERSRWRGGRASIGWFEE